MTATTAEVFHTQDEELRGYLTRGASAKVLEIVMRPLSEIEREAPYELNGFAD